MIKQFKYIFLFRKKTHNKILEFENFGKVWICWVYEKNRFIKKQGELTPEKMGKLHSRMQKSNSYYLNHA